MHNTPADDHLRAVARAHTLAVLEGLDPNRKRVLLGFLHESNLIHLDKPIISLLGANLEGANLIGANLRGADLRGAASLNQEQIDQVIRDEDTKLPDHLQL